MTTTAQPTFAEQLSKWYARHSNILVLIEHMAEHSASASEVVYAVEKPWKHEDVWREACQDNDLCPTCGGPTTVHYEDCQAVSA